MKFISFLLLTVVIVTMACSSNEKTIAQKSVGVPLEGTYWKLTELNGKAVRTGAGNNELYFILNHSNLQLTGNGGCNGFGGSYELNSNGINIYFSQLIRTEMACEDEGNMNQENRFLALIETVDSYSISGDQLLLNKGNTKGLALMKAQQPRPTNIVQ